MTEGDFYIFLSSKDSLRFHPGNKGYTSLWNFLREWN